MPLTRFKCIKIKGDIAEPAVLSYGKNSSMDLFRDRKSAVTTPHSKCCRKIVPITRNSLFSCKNRCSRIDPRTKTLLCERRGEKVCRRGRYGESKRFVMVGVTTSTKQILSRTLLYICMLLQRLHSFFTG